MTVAYLKKPYKVVVVVKSLHNFTIPRANDPHGFKEEVKLKFNAIMAIVGKFPNKTAFLEQLLAVDTLSKTYNDYCALGSDEQLPWNEKADELGIEILTSTDKPRQYSIDETSMQGTQVTNSNCRASQPSSYHLLDKLTKALKDKMMNRLA